MRWGWMVGACALWMAGAAAGRAEPVAESDADTVVVGAGDLERQPYWLSGESERRVPVTAESPATGGKPFDPRARPVRGRMGLLESQLSAAERTTETPPNWTGDIDRYPRPYWVDERIALHREYVEPFVISPVFPEFSVRLINMGGWNPRTRSVDVDQLLYVSLYALEFYAPLLTLRSSETFPVDHFRANLRLPVVFGRQTLALFVGTNLPVRGTLTADAGFNTMLGYAWGGPLLSVQARVGYGVDRLIGEVEAPFDSTGLADVAAALKVLDHLQIIAQADGKKLIGGPGGALRAQAGVRYFPLSQPTLSLGLAGLWWLDDLSGTGDFGTRRAGATLDLGYIFL